MQYKIQYKENTEFPKTEYIEADTDFIAFVKAVEILDLKNLQDSKLVFLENLDTKKVFIDRISAEDILMSYAADEIKRYFDQAVVESLLAHSQGIHAN